MLNKTKTVAILLISLIVLVVAFEVYRRKSAKKAITPTATTEEKKDTPAA